MAEYKDIAPLKKQIADVKKAVRSPNSDYLTGYLCALSATEGIIAELPTADVVEVVRCKDCVAREEFAPNKFHCKNTGYYCGETGYCSDGVRTPQKEEE